MFVVASFGTPPNTSFPIPTTRASLASLRRYLRDAIERAALPLPTVLRNKCAPHALDLGEFAEPKAVLEERCWTLNRVELNEGGVRRD